jgi:hypothetical protein
MAHVSSLNPSISLLAIDITLLNIAVLAIWNSDAGTSPLLFSCNIGKAGPTVSFNINFSKSDSRTELLGLPGLVDDAIELVDFLKSEACRVLAVLCSIYQRTWEGA